MRRALLSTLAATFLLAGCDVAGVDEGVVPDPLREDRTVASPSPDDTLLNVTIRTWRGSELQSERTAVEPRPFVWVSNRFASDVIVEAWSGRDLSWSGGTVRGHDLRPVTVWTSNTNFTPIAAGSLRRLTAESLPQTLILVGVEPSTPSGPIEALAQRVFADLAPGDTLVLEPSGTLSRTGRP